MLLSDFALMTSFSTRHRVSEKLFLSLYIADLLILHLMEAVSAGTGKTVLRYPRKRQLFSEFTKYCYRCYVLSSRPYIIVKNGRPRVADRHIQELAQGFR